MNLLIILPIIGISLLSISIAIGHPWKRGINIASSFVYILVAILLFLIPQLIPLSPKDAHSNYGDIGSTIYGFLALTLFSLFAVIMMCIDLGLVRKNAQPSVGIKIICGLIYILTLTIFLWGFNLALGNR